MTLLEEVGWYIKKYSDPPTGREVEGTVELLERVAEYIKEKEGLHGD